MKLYTLTEHLLSKATGVMKKTNKQKEMEMIRNLKECTVVYINKELHIVFLLLVLLAWVNLSVISTLILISIVTESANEI